MIFTDHKVHKPPEILGKDADTSFTTPEWPTNLKRQRDIHSCE